MSAAVRHFVDLAAALPGTAVHYAVKANPHPQLLARAGRRRLPVRRRQPGRGPRGARRRRDARRPRLLQPGQASRPRRRVAPRSGVRLFVVDSPGRGRQGRRGRARAAGCCAGSSPPARAPTGRCRASTAARPYEAVEVLTLADQLGLEAAGVSFHVGSQQRDPEAWAEPIAAAARSSTLLRARGLRPAAARPRRRLPGLARGRLPPVAAYGEAIERHLAALLRRRPSRRPWSSRAAASSATPAPSSPR